MFVLWQRSTFKYEVYMSGDDRMKEGEFDIGRLLEDRLREGANLPPLQAALDGATRLIDVGTRAVIAHSEDAGKQIAAAIGPETEQETEKFHAALNKGDIADAARNFVTMNSALAGELPGAVLHAYEDATNPLRPAPESEFKKRPKPHGHGAR